MGGWGHPQGDLHMLAVVAVCRNALVGTGWSNSCLVCTNRLRKHCSHLVGSSFLAVKVFSALNVCWPKMLTKQSSLMSRRGRVTSLLIIIAASTLGFSFGVRARTEMKIWCIVGMHKVKMV